MSVSQILGTMDHHDPLKVSPGEIFRRLVDGKAISYQHYYCHLRSGQLLDSDIPDQYAAPWLQVSTDHF